MLLDPIETHQRSPKLPLVQQLVLPRPDQTPQRAVPLALPLHPHRPVLLIAQHRLPRVAIIQNAPRQPRHDILRVHDPERVRDRRVVRAREPRVPHARRAERVARHGGARRCRGGDRAQSGDGAAGKVEGGDLGECAAEAVPDEDDGGVALGLHLEVLDDLEDGVLDRRVLLPEPGVHSNILAADGNRGLQDHGVVHGVVEVGGSAERHDDLFPRGV
mmetsp:Transcript_29490/g.74091  ORF Transcript_29490/g.74091 Transcript_29490/m.74091 type:complete len:217 (+) Transcript_29490:490-1140(+)